MINPETRVTKARVVVQNNDRILKPEMFVSGEVKAKLGKTVDQVTVPKSAVMWTGKRSVVYVKLPSDQGLHFKMREVTLGPSLGDAYIIEKGLEPGEEIAVNGTFSIDAAAQLAGKPSMMSRQTASSEGGAAMTGHDHDDSMSGLSDLLIDVNDETDLDTVLSIIFEAYLPIKDALIENDLENAKKATKSFKMIANQQIKTSANQNINLNTDAVDQITESNDLESVRTAFSKLSDQLFHTLKKYQVEVDGYRQFCPMAFDNKGGFWLSDSDKILNPYFGDAMLTCGEVVEQLN